MSAVEQRVAALVAAKRANHVAALYRVADLLAAHPDVPVPTVDPYEIVWHFLTDDANAKSGMARTVRAMPGRFTKNDPTGGYSETYYELRGSLAGFPVRLVAYRAAVCERVVTGTERVVRQVAAAPAVEAHEVVEDVDTVEWVCTPLLAAAVSS